MIEMLKKYKDGTFDVVSLDEIKVGDSFQIGTNDGKEIHTRITKIIEQRKEKGVYIDEKNRRMWAKVS